MVEAVIEAATRDPALRSLVLGSDAYQQIHEALTNRLAEVTAQRDSAYATDLRLRQPS